MSMFSGPSPLLPLLDSKLDSGVSIQFYRSLMELVYGRLERGSETALLMTELVHVKQPHHISKHEYVVVTVEGPNNILRYFAFERLRGDVISTNQAPSSVSPTFTSITPHSDAWDARDVITILPAQGREGDEIIARLPCQAFKLYLHHLVVLADVVNWQAPRYELLDTNCSWFVEMITGTIGMALETSAMKDVQTTPATENLPKPFIKILDRSSKAGYWEFVKLRGKVSREVIEETEYAWQKAVDVFTDTIEEYRRPLAEARMDTQALRAELIRRNGGRISAAIHMLFR